MGAVEADLIAQMYAVRLDDSAAHTRLVMALQMNSAVTRHLGNVVQDGTRAQEQLQLRGSRID